MNEQIVTSSANEFFSIINEYKKIYSASESQLKEMLESEEISCIKRKIISMITSSDDKVSFGAIQWVHGVITQANNLNLEIRNREKFKKADEFYLSPVQQKIYKSFRLKVTTNQPGDDIYLKILAVNVDHYNQLSEVISSTGFKMEFKTGAVQVRPEATMLRECTNTIINIIEKMGISSGTKSGKKTSDAKTIMGLIKTKAN